MKILILNCGSSSLKFQVIDMDGEKVLVKGNYESIGGKRANLRFKANGQKVELEKAARDYEEAVKFVLNLIQNPEYNIIKSLDEIGAVGHRIVHGGEYYSESVLITDEVLEGIADCIPLAPLHNPEGLAGIKATQKALPGIPMVAVFDTAFHQTMAKEQYMYALPMDWYTKYGVRKYGAHGTSHKYISKVMKEFYGEDKKLIVCHVGNGASITAIKDGRCIDTSMGFTPNAGLIMGSRCGDIDVSIIPYMMDKININSKDIDRIINKESGLLGISQVGSDFRDICAGVDSGNENCQLAYNMYINRIVDYIAKYYVELGGADAICFTAGVLENTPRARLSVMQKLDCLGVIPDMEANNVPSQFQKVSANDSKIDCFIVPTDEELMIAEDTYELVLQGL